MIRRLFVIVVLIFLYHFGFSNDNIHSEKGQHLLTTSGKFIVNGNQDTILLRGMGLGGWMLQEGYMLQTSGFANAQHQIREKIEDLIGVVDTDIFYEAWLNNSIRKIDIDSMKSWGFNSVRLPMHYNLYTLSIQDEPIPGNHTWLDKGFELTDSLISWCSQNEMYVILDLHGAPGGQGEDQAISDYNPNFPSLWESVDNRNKTVALWKKLAERYANEDWVAGYDLINETNWNLPGNTALKNLYKEITDSIRTVDTNHIIFIEGNWWANDFTGLTPPWDNNIVYSPHKYWSYNDQASIQWVIDMSNTYNVPLYLSESGENSNVWFTDAIKLFELNNIGWAWWPLKKVESISCPLSIVKSTEYQVLLDYWNNGGANPGPVYAKNALMDLTEKIKLENCVYQKDVIDAMFRQVNSDETKPFTNHTIPGTIYASDYDLGVIGEAYYDNVSGTYQVSTGEYTAWNTGWAYRNDGVDIQACNDIYSNGYTIAWIDNDEWMQYDVDVLNSAVYDINIRLASGNTGGKLHFSVDNSGLTSSHTISSTGGWQNWNTYTIEDVILYSDDDKLRLYVDNEGFNVNSFEFVETGLISSVETEYISAFTVDHSNIQFNVNKYLDSSVNLNPSDFEIYSGSNLLTITHIDYDSDNLRAINIGVDYIFMEDESIWLSYSGSQVISEDGSYLPTFLYKAVNYTLEFVHLIPGKIEAEDFSEQSGVELETTTDVGGGENVGYLDPGDFLDYEVLVAETGEYKVDYRTSGDNGVGGLKLQVVNENGTVNTLGSIYFASTGGWQTWATTSDFVNLTQGLHKFRILITQAPFNLNWFEFEKTVSIDNIDDKIPAIVNIYPNPVMDETNIFVDAFETQDISIKLINSLGEIVYHIEKKQVNYIDEKISVRNIPSGYYTLDIRFENGRVFNEKLIITGR